MERIKCPHCGAHITLVVVVPEETPVAKPTPTWPNGFETKRPSNVVDMKTYGYKEKVQRLDNEIADLDSGDVQK